MVRKVSFPDCPADSGLQLRAQRLERPEEQALTGLLWQLYLCVDPVHQPACSAQLPGELMEAVKHGEPWASAPNDAIGPNCDSA